MHNQGRMKDLLRIHGILLRHTGVEGPFQLGRGERQGSFFEEILKSAVEEKQITGTAAMKQLISESCVVKNMRLNHLGFSPYQWVLDKLPLDATSLTSEESEGRCLGVNEDILEPEDEFAQQLQIRLAAKEAFTRVDSSRRIRAALLRKSIPSRGPFSPGDLVCFHRRGQWNGPGRIAEREGRAAVCVVHGGVPLVVLESSLRPASSSEIFTKQLLELHPSRKRLREAVSDSNSPEHVPFGDDLLLPGWQDEEAQPGFLELDGPLSVPMSDDNIQQPAGEVPQLPQPIQPDPLPMIDEQHPQHNQPDQIPQQHDLVPTVVTTTNNQAVENSPVSQIDIDSEGDANLEPEGEVIPDTPQPAVTQLQQAMRTSVDQLDGLPRPPGLRLRSRSPLREPKNVRVPEGPALIADLEPNTWFHRFLAKRYNKKKKKQLRPHTEINFDKADQSKKDKITEARLKEWNNWMKFNAVKVIPPEEVDAFLQAHPEAEVLPTRWVDTNKAKVGEKEKLKSRLVVRGDLEEDGSVRTDSPTISQLILNLIISFAAATGLRLRAGDISAAFLQGATIARLLALLHTKTGIPDPNIKPGSLLIAQKSVYGTCDAPRGFFKELAKILIAAGLKPIPYEPAAFYLAGESGCIESILGCHVDDLLWSGTDRMQQVMMEVQKTFQFGLVEDDVLKCCGRVITQTSKGINVTCPNVLDRTRPIFLTKERRAQTAAPAAASEISQLRSIVGTLSWLGRVCRPDISFAVNQLQAV